MPAAAAGIESGATRTKTTTPANATTSKASSKSYTQEKCGAIPSYVISDSQLHLSLAQGRTVQGPHGFGVYKASGILRLRRSHWILRFKAPWRAPFVWDSEWGVFGFRTAGPRCLRMWD